jgi:hypothetical protein
MSIKQDVIELQHINTEIARLSKSISKLRETKRVLETRISDYLKRENLPAIKDSTKGIIIKMDTRQRTIVEKPKKQRDQEAIELLTSAGVNNADEVFERLKNVGRNSVQKNVIKINKIMQ